MTHTYKISGMTCTGCQAKVQDVLAKVPGVRQVQIDLAKGEATIDMTSHVSTSTLQFALQPYPKYQLSEKISAPVTMPVEEEETKSWFATYKPIILVFGYILLVTLSIEYVSGDFLWMRWMGHFMAGFFLVFSFFKLLDVRSFAESYSMYDIVAKRWRAWGFIYPFAELLLGFAFLTGFDPVITNTATFIIMGVSIVGVLQSVLNKRKIKCACLGAVFNLPMSTITIIEDALMIGMSLLMLIRLLYP